MDLARGNAFGSVVLLCSRWLSPKETLGTAKRWFGFIPCNSSMTKLYARDTLPSNLWEESTSSHPASKPAASNSYSSIIMNGMRSVRSPVGTEDV